MMKSIWTLLAILAAFSLGCSHKERQSVAKATIHLNIGEDPTTLDPQLARSLCDKTIMNMLYEGLTRINKDEKPEPALAQVIEVSADLKTYTFYLRPATWSTKEPVTAADFLRGWQKVLSPTSQADNAFQLYPIKNARLIKKGEMPVEALGVEVVDIATLKVHLEQPTPYFLELTAFPAFFPAPPVQQKSAASFCGPYALKKWSHNNEIIVEKNSAYWDAGNVHIDAIHMFMVREDTELRMYDKGELDWVGSPLSTLPVDAIKSLKEQGHLCDKMMLGTYFFRLNTSHPLLKHERVRKALALAIDREAICRHVLQGNQKIATGLVPPSMGLQVTPYFQDRDVQEAKDLFQKGLKDMGVDDKKSPSLTITFASSERSYLIAQAVQQQWKEALGIDVKLQPAERKVYFDMLARQSYDVAAGSWVADFNDPVNFLEVFKYMQASTNNTGWHNEQYTSLLDTSSKISDPHQRRAMLAKVEDLLIKQMPIIPVFYYNMLYMHKEHMQNVALSSMGMLDFKWATIAKDTSLEEK